MPPILNEFVVILGVALGVVLLFRRLQIPVIAGFLVAGVLVGPDGLGLVPDIEEVRAVAQVGIVLLLFTIGLETSLTGLARSWRLVLFGGGAQVVLTAVTAAAVLALTGADWRTALLVGLLVAMSSTAIVYKALDGRGELGTPHGRLALGILLFQDLAAIPIMAILPTIQPGAGERGLSAVLAPLAMAVGGMTAVLFAGRFIIPRLFATAVRTRSREVFTLMVVFVIFGTAWLTTRFGVSLALGAFLAGLILAESEYGPQAMAEVFPVKETFTGIFFTSFGMLLDLGFVGRHLPLVICGAGLVMVAKAVLATLAGRLVVPSWRVAAPAGVALSQVGEFALVLSGAALGAGLLSAERHQLFLAATLLTMLVSPFLASRAHSMVLGASRRLARGPVRDDAPEAVAASCSMSGHVVIVGYGLNGANLARVLTETRVPHLVLDMNPALVEEGRRAGHDVRYGDGTLAEVLHAAALPCARVLVAAISDPLATRQVVAVARRVNPNVHIIVRTRFLREIAELRRLGATDVVAEEFETSIEIFTRVLRELLVPRNVIAIQVDLVRRDGYGMLRGLRMPSRLRDQLGHILAASAVDNVQILEGAPAAGATLGQVDLRRNTGASIVAVIRDGKARTNPSADWRFEAGDIVVLIGAHAEVSAAERLLAGPPPGEDEPAL
jgi:CPA2 family monovalent cation:H+ antiporter-2